MKVTKEVPCDFCSKMLEFGNVSEYDTDSHRCRISFEEKFVTRICRICKGTISLNGKDWKEVLEERHYEDHHEPIDVS